MGVKVAIVGRPAEFADEKPWCGRRGVARSEASSSLPTVQDLAIPTGE